MTEDQLVNSDAEAEGTTQQTTELSSKFPTKIVAIAIVAGALLVGVVLGYLRATSIERIKVTAPSPIPQPVVTDTQSLTAYAFGATKVGNFTFAPPAGYLYGAKFDHTTAESKVTPISVSVSTIDTANECSGKASGIHGLFTHRFYPDESPDSTPFFAVTAWNNDTIDFNDQNGSEVAGYRENFDQYLKRLSALESYAISQNILGNAERFDSSGGGCSVGMYYPILVTKVNQNKFDAAYYVEAITGNDMYNAPEKSVFLRDGNDWMIVTEGQPQPADFSPWEVCSSRTYSSSSDEISCIGQAWRENHSDDTANQAWISLIMTMISKP